MKMKKNLDNLIVVPHEQSYMETIKYYLNTCCDK